MNFRIPSLVAVVIWSGFAVYVAAFTAEAYAETLSGLPDDAVKGSGKRKVRGLANRAKQAIRSGDITGGVPPLKPLSDLP